MQTQKQDYNAQMDRVLAEVAPGTPLLLHACCAPCASVALEKLAPVFDITLLFYNPNIDTAAEYARRRAALVQLVENLTLPRPVALLEDSWDPLPFYTALGGRDAQTASPALAGAPEGGARCGACIRLRLAAAAGEAKAHGFGWFGSTLTVGPRKDAGQIYAEGVAAAGLATAAAAGETIAPRFLPADLKKRGGFARSVQLCKEMGLYRQDYCGCVFSRRPAGG